MMYTRSIQKYLCCSALAHISWKGAQSLLFYLSIMDSTEALEAFIRRNKLSHVIRAHEVKATGFQVIHACSGEGWVVAHSDELPYEGLQ